MSRFVITLLSDLGTRDASVTIAKAILLRHAEAATIIDMSHNVVPYDLRQAAYLLLSAYDQFPKNTLHVLAVDIFAGNKPRLLFAEKDGYYFAAPDNGVLALAFGDEIKNTWLCHEFDKPYVFTDWIERAGTAAGSLQKKEQLPYPLAEIRMVPKLTQPKLVADGVECNVLYIDRYENVVLDITRKQFEEMVKGRPFTVRLGRTQTVRVISTNYSDVMKGDALCRFNDAGFLEIALNHAPAASLLGLGANNTANLRYKTIKIFF